MPLLYIFCIIKIRESEIAGDFSAIFQSVIGTGKLHLVEDREEKRKGLNAIMRQVATKP
mgnify:CR=1 FL=1